MSNALGDVRIVDFSRVLAGPLATMMLGDFGAEVTKIERPGTGDDTRAWGPPFDADGNATYFAAVNRNKSSLTLDLETADGRAHAQRLAAQSDVLVENFRPGVMERFGLGYEQLADECPSLIYCSITGFGSGTGADRPGYDLIVQAVGGLMSVTGESEGPPQKVGVAIVDVVCGLFASVGILTALRHRESSGRGQKVEVDLLSCLLAGLVNQASAYTLAGEIAGRMGNAHPSIAPYEPLAAADGEVVVAVGTDAQFAQLCSVLGRSDLPGDPRFVTNTARVRHRIELKAELEKALSAETAETWTLRLTGVGVPAGQVNDIGGAFALADELGLSPIVEVPSDSGSPVRLPRNPIRLSDSPASYRLAPPGRPDA